MLAEYMRRLTEKQDCPVVLSITDTAEATETKTVIHRNHIHDAEKVKSADIYLRARQIYFRARRHRPVRAASIF
jgi:hypothetical protein